MQESLPFDFDNINEEIKNIEIRYISSLISKRLYKKIQFLGCETVEDIFNINIDDFSLLGNVGNGTIKELKNLNYSILNNPDKIIDVYHDNSEMILPSQREATFLGSVSNLINEYFELNADEKAKNIITKRDGLFNESFQTLENIGLFYNISRERVRQIQKKHIEYLNQLLNREILKRNNCMAEGAIVKKFIELKKIILSADLLYEKKIDEIIHTLNIEIRTNNEKNLLFLLFELIGCKKYDHEEVIYFIFDNKINQKRFESACDLVFKILQNEVIPISLFDLIKLVREKDNKIDKEYIEYVVEMLPEIEKVNQEGAVYYQIKFSKLRSIKDYAYRILFEVQEIKHYSEICKEIQDRLIKEGVGFKESVRTIKNQLFADEKFIPIGRTGKWGLNTWDYDYSTIIELVIKAIHHFNRSCTIEEVSKFISKIRPEIKQNTINSIISQHNDKIKRTEDNKLILADWITKYDALAIKNSQKHVSMYEFCKVLQKINLEYPNKEFSRFDLKEILKGYNIFWKDRYCYNKFVNCPMLIKTIRKGERRKIYYRIDNNYIIPDRDTIKKLDRLKVKIINMISKSKDGILPLAEIAKKCEEFGELRPNVYTVISSNPKIFVKTKKEKIQYIELKKKT